MVIEILARLAAQMGAERISLEIAPSDGGSTSVMVVTSLGQSSANIGDEKQQRLQAVLSQPLVVTGNVGELDSRVVALVDDLEEVMVTTAKSLPETDAQKQKAALLAAQHDTKETAVKDEEGDTAVVDVSQDDMAADALAAGEANSL